MRSADYRSWRWRARSARRLGGAHLQAGVCERGEMGYPNRNGGKMRWRIALALALMLIAFLVVGTIDYNALVLP